VLAFVENGALGVVIADIQDEIGQKLANPSEPSDPYTSTATQPMKTNISNPLWNQLFNFMVILTSYSAVRAGIPSFGKQTVLDFDDVQGLIRQTLRNKRSWCSSMPN
jgi:hypothetical protein